MSDLPAKDLQLLERLNRHPRLKARMAELLSIAEDEKEIVKADDAEERLIEELRFLGNELLSDWAQKRLEKCEAALEQDTTVRRCGKKNSIGTARSGKSK